MYALVLFYLNDHCTLLVDPMNFISFVTVFIRCMRYLSEIAGPNNLENYQGCPNLFMPLYITIMVVSNGV